MNKSPVRGFTLIEVMIVVAIVAILARIALPAYTDYIRRGQLPEAFTNLSSTAVKMEQYFQDNRNYGSTGTSCGVAVPINQPYFDYSCSTTTNGFTMTAQGMRGRASGYTYTIDQDLNKKTTFFAGASVSKNCWASKSSEC